MKSLRILQDLLEDLSKDPHQDLQEIFIGSSRNPLGSVRICKRSLSSRIFRRPLQIFADLGGSLKIFEDPPKIFTRVYLYYVFVVFLFCLAFSSCQIALAFLCWMLISVGFYFGLQKITRTKNRASFKYQSHFLYQ